PRRLDGPLRRGERALRRRARRAPARAQHGGSGRAAARRRGRDRSDRAFSPEGVVMTYEVEKSETEWQTELTPEQFQVLRRAGTERAFTGKYWDCHDDGIYRCAACGAELFDANTKSESGPAGPSFTEPLVAEAVELVSDTTHGMVRTEVRCRRCGSHLGHVVHDGRPPTAHAHR